MTFTYFRQGPVTPLPRRLIKAILINAMCSGLLLAWTLPLTAQAKDAPLSDALTYRSVFEGYQAYTREKQPEWQQANERVRQIGGWRVYARESEEPAKESAPPTPATTADQSPKAMPATPLPATSAPPARAPAAHQHGDAHRSKP